MELNGALYLEEFVDCTSAEVKDSFLPMEECIFKKCCKKYKKKGKHCKNCPRK